MELTSASFSVDGKGGQGRGGVAKCSELHERAMRCVRRKLRLRLNERTVCVGGVGEGNGLLPPMRQGAKRCGWGALSESCSCRFRTVILCFRPRALVVSYTLYSERTSARYMGRAWPASMPLSSRAVTELMRAGGPCAVLGGNFCLGFVSGVALLPPFRKGA